MDRRQVLICIGSVLGYTIGITGWRRRLLAQDVGREDEAKPVQRRWLTRPVQPGDEAALVAVMRAAVADADSFHGQCAPMEWTKDWAQWVVETHPASLVIQEEGGQAVAFLDLPARKATNLSPEVERNQEAFWCGAGGVRSDLFSADESLQVFRLLLYQTFIRARELGFEYVRCASPWQKHPRLSTPFAQYPGLTIAPFTTDEGETRYLIEWRLQDAVVTLEAEGAGAFT